MALQKLPIWIQTFSKIREQASLNDYIANIFQINSSEKTNIQIFNTNEKNISNFKWEIVK